MSQEDADTALVIITDLKPEAADRLRKIREQDLDRFGQEVNQRFPQFHWLMRLKRYDPEMYELRMQDVRLTVRSRRIAQAWRRANEAGEADKAEQRSQELAEVVTEHFDLRRQIREAELERLAQRLEQLKAELEERASQRDALIEQQVQSLMEGQDEGRRDGPDRGRLRGPKNDDAPARD